MSKIIDYQIIHHWPKNKEDSVQAVLDYLVDKKVKIAMRHGWQPLGAPFMVRSAVAQAMVKYEDTK